MATYFSRHTAKLDIDEATRARLWNESRIAVHYPWLDNHNHGEHDTYSLDPKEYVNLGSRRAIGAIVTLARNGGYVCSQHRGHEEIMLGYIAPNSQIELLEGVWGDVWDRAGKKAVLKTLRLQRVKLVKPVDHAVLIVARPIQGTLMKWPSIGSIVENLVEGRRIEPTLSHLSPAQQEIMCSEFLRSPESATLPVLRHLLLPPGRTMKDLDVVGIADDGKRIMAQVTYSSENSEKVASKLERLKPYMDDNSHLIMFCACSAPKVRDGVTVYPLEDVFQKFKNTKTGAHWLKHSC